VSSGEGKARPTKAAKANITRRALIEVGWVLPAVIVVSIPSKAFAEYGGPPVPDTADSKGGGDSHGPGGGVEHEGASSHSDP